eukprot:m51a1_g14661 putative pleckstrin homology domain-containing protein 1-like (292) ;mRNA; r:13200-15564
MDEATAQLVAEFVECVRYEDCRSFLQKHPELIRQDVCDSLFERACMIWDEAPHEVVERFVRASQMVNYLVDVRRATAGQQDITLFFHRLLDDPEADAFRAAFEQQVRSILEGVERMWAKRRAAGAAQRPAEATASAAAVTATATTRGASNGAALLSSPPQPPVLSSPPQQPAHPHPYPHPHPHGSRSDGDVLFTGYLTKLGERMKSWKRRFFILTTSTLLYYIDSTKITPKGKITITEISGVKLTTLAGKEDKFAFEVITKRRVFVFLADKEAERTRWIDEFRKLHLPISQ